ncbi:MAG: hypothetical protein JW850_17715 [Thermoflexales bacterium]|nr:hypothetical protein [Thermoflexales bacterium]
MTSVEERLQILKMVEEGKITAEEGAKLLSALSGGARGEKPAEGGAGARWFRVRVVDLDTGKDKVNVNIPMGLVNVGIKMGARFAPEIEGMDIDEIVSAIKSGAQGKIVDVIDEADGERVEIFVE